MAKPKFQQIQLSVGWKNVAEFEESELSSGVGVLFPKTHKEDRNRILSSGGLQSVSDSETDVTVNLSTFAELLMANDDGTKDQQKRVDGPQL